jgi:hypothetical protein
MYERLYTWNNWNVITYHRAPRTQPMTSEEEKASLVMLKEGAPVAVRWPDGTCETLPLVMQTTTARTGDMGHFYDTRQEWFGVTGSVHGIMVWVELTRIEVAL